MVRHSVFDFKCNLGALTDGRGILDTFLSKLRLKNRESSFGLKKKKNLSLGAKIVASFGIWIFFPVFRLGGVSFLAAFPYVLFILLMDR